MMRNFGDCMEYYEIWCNSQDDGEPTREYTFISKRKAIKKMQRCNKDCEWGKPYFIKIVKTDD